MIFAYELFLPPMSKTLKVFVSALPIIESLPQNFNLCYGFFIRQCPFFFASVFFSVFAIAMRKKGY